MPERFINLRSMLDELERELEALDTLDEATRARLEETKRDIQAALEKNEPAEVEHESFIERLNDAAQDFETSHPRLTVTIGRIVDALAQLGI